jgi:dihydroneopterin triphosphate diphosphatase
MQQRELEVPFFTSNMTYKIPESILVVIHTADLQVLLINRADKPGFWQSVTGSKDSIDEPLFETARREVLEETGIRVTENVCRNENDIPLSNLRDWGVSNIYEIYPEWRYRYAPDVTKNTEHVFGLLVPRNVPIALEPREHLQFLWLPYREAADKCFSPSNAEAILQLPKFF